MLAGATNNVSHFLPCINPSLNKKLSCRREAAPWFVFVCSQLQHTYSAVFYYQLLPLQIY